ncbi:MAG: PDGLE domain-containing protein [Lentisphaerae bacterium]|nr:PDGLE domain-containing protein [Lentisphaerota bacterium]
MHIPDGFLDAKTLALSGALALGALALAVRTAQRNLPPRRVPLIGITAAFVFAAQMLNFPVAGGTSGHLLGGVLAATMVGPSAAVLVITCVLIIQAFLFADGGILALGANVFNMAIVGTIGGYGIYWLVRRVASGLRGQLMAAAFAAWCSVVLAAGSCAAQLAFSGTVAWTLVLPVMTGIHMLIGIGESLITALVLLAVARTRPELLTEIADGHKGLLWERLAFGLLIALGLAVFAAPFASRKPDGLEYVAQVQRFEHKAVEKNIVPAPLPDYTIRGISSPGMATALAGGIGTVLMFGFAFLLARALLQNKSHAS